MSENHSLRGSRRARSRDHGRIPGFDLSTVDQSVLALGVHESGGPEFAEQGGSSRWRQPGINGQHSVAVVPGSTQGIDPIGAAGEIQGHELKHNLHPMAVGSTIGKGTSVFA